MKAVFTLSILIACTATPYTSFAQAPAPDARPRIEAPPSPNPQNRLISKDAFCKRLQATFGQYAAQAGYDRSQTRMLASSAAHAVIEEFRSGRATDFMNANVLAHYAGLPVAQNQDHYLQLAGFIGSAMGLSNNVSLALSTGELRFIPYAPKDSDIVVIASNAAALTPERVQRIIQVAQTNRIRISVLWVGMGSEDPLESAKTQLLGMIASMTGGLLANLGGEDTACGTLM